MSTATTATDRGSLTWAIRDSLWRYITVIAGGSYEVDGGAVVDDAGVVTFPLREHTEDGAAAAWTFDGAVRLRAHRGFMDITISEPRVVIAGDAGELTVKDPEGSPRRLVIAHLTRDSAQPETTFAALLAPAGVELFGTVYPEGAELAPLFVRPRADS